ncbi:hypothetical protein [Paenibacillus ginsengarvi]|uniref:Uncharacterized protein n=1 Tax=Paenibacillus ginsengarvi TaxID=400777 RepID=A0A3B0BIG2_9BACL|nr:hypothetical protein [Paenibacillus ginsengarvi]RKN72431.1 hypothetical protein D7M11_28550 [Paenibacillus ginsengarvi]
MKLRWLPIAASIIVSSVVLFGGWFLYDSLAMENPLSRIVQETPGVGPSQISVGSDKVTIELTPKQDASIREIYKSITEKGSSIIGKRDVELAIKDSSTPELDRWWSDALFDVAEAMEGKRYALIPAALDAKKSTYPGMQVSTEMDDKYVYVHMTDGTNDKYVLLPRTTPKMGVWPNE